MHSSSRNGHAVRVLAVHTTEGIMRAADLRAWTGWTGSSHASADDTGALLDGAKDGFVDHDRASWTLRSGNPWSENIELCGFAKWNRATWLGKPKLLDACARWLAARSKARGIPLVKLSPAEYRAGKSGVIGHHDHTVGYSDGTHWDPGPDFPWDLVLAKAALYRDGKEAPPAPEEEDDLMAAIKYVVVFASPEEGPDKDKVYECNMLNGTRVHLKTEQTVNDRKHWLNKLGIPWMDARGAKGMEVGRIDAFGIDLVQAVADEVQRRQAAA